MTRQRSNRDDPLRPSDPSEEEIRLAALRHYRILDTDPEPHFDHIARLAQRQLDAPIALVAFLDRTRNFFKAHLGTPLSEAPRETSFCRHAILGTDAMVVLDAKEDPRFAENPEVTRDGVRFYAGAPLLTTGGQRLGTLCVLDTKPRSKFGSRDRALLVDLAAVVVDHLEMRALIGQVHDEIEMRRAAEKQAIHAANHDVLTCLPNRAYLQSVIAGELPFATSGVLTAFALDLDHFKSANDALGHYGADDYLRIIAGKIKRALPDRSLVARVSGDEFTALFDAIDHDDALRRAAELVEIGRQPEYLNGQEVVIGFSLGVALLDPSQAKDVSQLLRNADVALFRAKRAGRQRFVEFSEDIAVDARRRGELKRELALALASKKIRVEYQPICDAASGEMVAVEALARWNHETLGDIGPAEFIPVAEETGMIIELGEYVLRTSLHAALQWPDLNVSVNLSAVQFRLPDLDSRISRIIKEVAFPAPRLQLEITETVFVNDLDGARRQLDALHALGVRMALDDFGTGYSSLSYLRSLPFDKIKIDRSFVRGMISDRGDQAIVQYIISLARQLDMNVTAEGVETPIQAELLRVAGCTTLQGYLFGSAMPAEAITHRLSSLRERA